MKKTAGLVLTVLCASAVAASAADFGVKMIYGNDDRSDYYAAPVPMRQLADSTVSLFKAGAVAADGTLTLENYAKAYSLCKTERFSDQSVGAFCSGSLVGPDLVMTAGHCITSASDCANTKIVFGFAVKKAGVLPVKAAPDDVYSCNKILAQMFTSTTDYALIRLDRAVVKHSPLRLDTSGKIAVGDNLVVIGHPNGLPEKIAGGASVRSVNDIFFVANLDTYGGNSGSPVFNRDTRLVEGILVRGDTDFVADPTATDGCRISNRATDTGGKGEDVTRLSLVLPFITKAAVPSTVAAPIVPTAPAAKDISVKAVSFDGSN